MIPSSACIDLIKRFEGCRLKAYPDPGSGGDPWTIGWGHTGPEVRRGLVWTQAQADATLIADVNHFAEKINVMIQEFATTQGEFDALVSFAYNLGIGSLKSSTLFKLHMVGKKVEAADQFKRWNKAGGRVLPGLTKRREAEAALYAGHPM